MKIVNCKLKIISCGILILIISSLLVAVFNQARQIEVDDLKETFTKEYLIQSGQVTLEEYNAVPLINYRPNRNRVQDFASLSHQVVGAETH